MADWTSIANLALVGLGVRQVASLQDGSVASARINAVLPQCVDETLYAHPWKAAMARALLPSLAAVPVFGYALAYALPAQPWCLRPWSIQDEDGTWFNYDQPDCGWSVEGRQILTDMTGPLPLRYIARVADPNLFTGPLATALALRLQWATAYAFTNSREAEEGARQSFAGFLPDARSLDSQQGTPPPLRRSDILGARF